MKWLVVLEKSAHLKEVVRQLHVLGRRRGAALFHLPAAQDPLQLRLAQRNEVWNRCGQVRPREVRRDCCFERGVRV